MKRPFARLRSLLLIMALTVVTAISTASTARAVPSTPGTGGAAGSRTADAASSAPCNLKHTISECQSTDPTVTLSTEATGNTSNCTFVWYLLWGDGHTTTATEIDPPDGWKTIAQHTYAAAGTYTVTATGTPSSGCNLYPFVVAFTLLPPPPPSGSSPNKCRIDVRAVGVLPGVLGRSGYHLWVVYTDMTGATHHYEALPNPFPWNPFHQGYIQTSQGKGAKSKVEGQHPITAGPVTARSGSDACGKDSSGNPVPGFNPKVVTQGPPACFLRQMAQIDKAKIPYNWYTTNSNAFVHTILVNCGIKPVKPNVNTPGWNWLLND